MRFAVCQMKPVLGSLEKNFSKIKAMTVEAINNDADMIVFPELAFSGNNLLDKVNEMALGLKSKYVGELVDITDKDLIIGMPLKKADKIHNSAVYISEANIKAVQGKINLDKQVFYNENEYYSADQSYNIFEIFDKKGVILIGNDIFDFENTSQFNEVSYIFHLHNSYLGCKNEEKLFDAYRFYSNVLGKKIISCNRVGVEDGIIFSGNSGVFKGKNAKYFSEEAFDEKVFYFDL